MQVQFGQGLPNQRQVSLSGECLIYLLVDLGVMVALVVTTKLGMIQVDRVDSVDQQKISTRGGMMHQRLQHRHHHRLLNLLLHLLLHPLLSVTNLNSTVLTQ